jgi:hypothetical protein
MPPELIEQYKAYVEDVGRIGKQHAGSRKFYLSVISALLVFLSMAGEDGPFKGVQYSVQVIVAIAGMVICVFWFFHMRAFGALYKAKFTVLRQMEGLGLPHPIFGAEWDILKKDGRYTLLTKLDSFLPVVFLLICGSVLFLK